MNYFDIAILVVMALFLVVGFWKGFIKTGLALASWGVSFLLIYLFAKKLGDMMLGSSIGNFFRDTFLKIYNLGENGTQTITMVDGVATLSNGTLVSAALATLAIPGFMKNGMLPFFTDGATFESALGNGLASYALMAVAAIGIIIVVIIVFKIGGIFITKAMKGKKIGVVNRVFGGVLEIGIAIFFISAVMLLLDLMSSLSFMNKVIAMRDSGVISKLFVQYNPITLILQALVK